MLRYMSYDLAARSCECCGASLAYGAVVLSDGRRYGRQCASKAISGGRETAGAARKVEALRREAFNASLAKVWKGLDRTGWSRQSSRRIVLDELTVWNTPHGLRLEVDGSTTILHLRDRGYQPVARHAQGDRAIYAEWPASVLE